MPHLGGVLAEEVKMFLHWLARRVLRTIESRAAGLDVTCGAPQPPARRATWSEMPFTLCPSCAYANTADASFCNACGESLFARCPNCAARNAAGAMRCTDCSAPLEPGATGMVHLPLSTDPAPPWEDETTEPGRLHAEPEAAPPLLTLLDPREDAVTSPAAAEAGVQAGLIRSDPDALVPQPWPDSPLAAPRNGAALPTLNEVVGTISKAQRRAAVRRNRLALQPPGGIDATAVPDVLVLDADDKARAQLCDLLGRFGFRAHAVVDAAEARVLLAERSFAAVFLSVEFDGTDSDDAAALCLRAQQPPDGFGRRAALVVVGSGARPTERVRASMAGADQFLVKPAGRGDVARALDACGVGLPSDPRRL